MFASAARQLCASREAPSLEVLEALVYGWGNENWCAPAPYLAACYATAATAQHAVLECGSGLSTLVLAAAARSSHQVVWSLEHDPGWVRTVSQRLHDLGMDSARVQLATLRNYGCFDWYDPPLDQLPRRFSVVVCDGPPGRTRGGRYGLMSVMGDRLVPGTTILLDDAQREAEREIVCRWEREFDLTVLPRRSSERHIVLRVGTGCGSVSG